MKSSKWLREKKNKTKNKRREKGRETEAVKNFNLKEKKEAHGTNLATYYKTIRLRVVDPFEFEA